MKLHAHSTAESFLASATARLATDEARHNLAYGICDTIVRSPEAYPTFYLWTVEGGGSTVVAAVMTPPFNIVVTRPQMDEALEFLAGELHGQGLELPGATGALPEIDVFTAAWAERTGAVRERRGAHGIYAARAIQVPENVPGRMRPATPADRELLISWWDAFVEEALPDAPVRDHETLIDRRLEGHGAGPVALGGRSHGRHGRIRGLDTLRRSHRSRLYAPRLPRTRLRQRAHGGAERRSARRWPHLLLPLHRSREPDVEPHLREDRLRVRLRVDRVRV